MRSGTTNSTRRDITPTLAQIRHRERDRVHSLRSASFANTAELDELTQWTPEAWWRPLVPRCPKCGDQGHQVSPTFEATPQGYSRVWAALPTRLTPGCVAAKTWDKSATPTRFGKRRMLSIIRALHKQQKQTITDHDERKQRRK